jgi:hypothetical protein
MLLVTTKDDLPKINEWIAADPWHREDKNNTAEFLLTGNGELAFKVTDDIGSLCFVRLDKEGERLRLATQFGPESEVSKKRLIVGLLKEGIPGIICFATGVQPAYKGIVFESVNESLIEFMGKQGFFHDKADDYVLTFEENICAI